MNVYVFSAVDRSGAILTVFSKEEFALKFAADVLLNEANLACKGDNVAVIKGIQGDFLRDLIEEKKDVKKALQFFNECQNLSRWTVSEVELIEDFVPLKFG